MQSSEIIGLDVGGANLKAARADGPCRTRPFALWKTPQRLPAELRTLLDGWSAGRLAVTMTGELCDCFETKRAGVRAILDAVVAAAGSAQVVVWTTAGRFVPLERARKDELACAAANWLALATFAGRFVPGGPALLIDIGSTTADIVPLRDGVPVPRGRTDTERLKFRELLYTGVRRTPVCAILGSNGMAEFFATTHDVDLVLRRVSEEPHNNDTADGRPATRPFALARLARMMGGDAETMSETEIEALATSVLERQRQIIRDALPIESATSVIVSGAGERLAREALSVPARSLREKLGPDASTAGCAYAVAILAAEGKHGP